MRITLQLVSILEQTLPAALSHFWGGPKNRVPIEIEGKFIHVIENCHAVLRALRHRTDTKLLWGDAICIEQGNAEEKGEKVALMGDIYQKAERAVAWLGPDSSEEGLAKTEDELMRATEVIEEFLLQEGEDFEAFYRAI
jgi:hypothetical protein